LSIPPQRAFDCRAARCGPPAAGGRRVAASRLLAQLRRAAQVALPQACALCAGPSRAGLVCPGCARDLPRLPPACAVCALPAAGVDVCARCLAAPPPFAATVAAFPYRFPVDRLLHRLKYGGHLAYADWLGARLADAVAGGLPARMHAAVPDCAVALPLSPSRQRERGFNQAREIARRCARELEVPLAEPLARSGPSLPQAGQPLRERIANVRGAFSCRACLAGASVALIDDVMTTGATLADAASALRRAGADRVECWVVARTLPPASW
jgi:ComF family protein